MHWLSCTCGSTWREWGHLFLRIVTGLIFFMHGYQKVVTSGVENTISFFAGVGIPFANVLAYLVAYGELIGGAFLIVGLLTHWVAKADILIMLGAIYFVHWSNGFSMSNGGYEYALLLLAASVYFVMSGSGKYSIDAHLFKKSEPAVM